MTWGDFQDCLEGYNDHLKRWRSEIDAMNHTLGCYVSYSVNDPKHYPKQPFHKLSEQQEQNTARTDDQRMRMARLKYGKKKE